jgi:uncharacterized membrane protein YgcG
LPPPPPPRPTQTWLRVALGYHTWPQVIVGGLLGAGTAGAWFAWGAGAAVPALRAAPAGLPMLYASTAVGVTLFAARNVLAWHRERTSGCSGGGGKLRSSDPGSGGSDGDRGGSWAPAPAG